LSILLNSVWTSAYNNFNPGIRTDQNIKSNVTFAFAIIMIGAIAQHKAKPTPKVPRVAKLTYSKGVGAVITKSCAGCHTGASGKAGLDLSTYAGVMKGNKEGKIVKVGSPSKSMLCTVLHGKPKQMPPKALDAKTIAMLELWVKQGAKEK
jgi:mono/diheme cytochrome c family protein